LFPGIILFLCFQAQKNTAGAAVVLRGLYSYIIIKKSSLNIIRLHHHTLMLRIAFIALFLFSSAAHATDMENIKTIVHDEAEAKLLLGRHPVTTAELAGDFWSRRLGQSIIYKYKGIYYMHGGHALFYEVKGVPNWGGGSVILKGVITEIHNKGFIFEGIVTTEKLEANESATCILQGRFEFSRDTSMEMENYSDKEYEDYTYGEDFWRSIKGPRGYDPEGRSCDVHRYFDGGYVDVMVRSLGFVDEADN
jgi:hypothetical protein